jgi:hypothetical protein
MQNRQFVTDSLLLGCLDGEWWEAHASNSPVAGAISDGIDGLPQPRVALGCGIARSGVNAGGHYRIMDHTRNAGFGLKSPFGDERAMIWVGPDLFECEKATPGSLLEWIKMHRPIVFCQEMKLVKAFVPIGGREAAVFHGESLDVDLYRDGMFVPMSIRSVDSVFKRYCDPALWRDQQGYKGWLDKHNRQDRCELWSNHGYYIETVLRPYTVVVPRVIDSLAGRMTLRHGAIDCLARLLAHSLVSVVVNDCPTQMIFMDCPDKHYLVKVSKVMIDANIHKHLRISRYKAKYGRLRICNLLVNFGFSPITVPWCFYHMSVGEFLEWYSAIPRTQFVVEAFSYINVLALLVIAMTMCPSSDMSGFIENY